MKAANLADSAFLIGKVRVGKKVYFSQGTTIRSLENSIKLENSTIVLENSVVIGTPQFPVKVGSKTVFGHKSIIIGATIGNLCEIGNSTMIMQGASLGDMCIIGEGTIIPEGMHISDNSVVVGRPGRIIRKLTDGDRQMISKMRGDDLNLYTYEEQLIEHFPKEEDMMGKLYAYKDTYPQIAESALLFESAEITGDVVIGEKTIIGAGVKIIGGAHGPIRIGNNVQILENSVLHLLPDNELVIEDDVIIGPGCMIHGCRIGTGTVIEAGAIVCDYSILGQNTLVKAGTLIKQRSEFPDQVILEGYSAKILDSSTGKIEVPLWSFQYDDIKKFMIERAKKDL